MHKTSWFGDEDASRRREQDHRQGNQGQSHRGRGPSNYIRSDEHIREDGNEHLTHDHHVDASHITISVKDGELTLDGTVDSRAAKRRAEDVVEHISGVMHVQNNLRVQDRSSTSGLPGESYGSASSSTGSTYGQNSNQPAGSAVSGQYGASGSTTSAAAGSTASSGTLGTPGSSTATPGQTVASTTSGIGSPATAGVGSASATTSSDKTN